MSSPLQSSWVDELAHFVAIKTVTNHATENAIAVEYLRAYLQKLGFVVDVKGSKQSGQPLLVARYHADESSTLPASLVMYNHYDVEKISDDEQWLSEPFSLLEKDARWYARGIADNKAVLLARLAVLEQRLLNGQALPNMLWLIQGEEEVGAGLAHQLFPSELAHETPVICLEETGYHREGVPLLFHQFDESVADNEAASLADSLNQAVFAGSARRELRPMTKFGPCPFFNNLPKGSHYIGFGPNDYQARIHQDNESMDQQLLADYFLRFNRFLDWLPTVSHSRA